MSAFISNIAIYLPEKKLTNEVLSKSFPAWSPDKILNKTGIAERAIADNSETASDLAEKAAIKLFEQGKCQSSEVDFILFCTQSPDFILPTTACLLQNKLGCRKEIGALDFNLGCSGYVYGLSLAKGLIETGQVSNVLLLTGDTYSKYLAPEDHAVRTIFGDAGSATWIKNCPNKNQNQNNKPTRSGLDSGIFAVSFGTDGQGADNLKINAGGARCPEGSRYLKMNGPEIFAFTLNVVPKVIDQTLQKANLELDQIDFFIFHQANAYMLSHLRDKLKIPREKFIIDLEATGNTVSSSIPLALKRAIESGKIEIKNKNKKLLALMVGFGVGYSWGAVLVNLSEWHA